MDSGVKGFRIGGGVFILMALSILLYSPLKKENRETSWLYAQAENADQDNPNFDFSVYFTGNVRGNLEPCG